MAQPIAPLRQIDESISQGDVIKQLPGHKSSNPTSYNSVGTMTNDAILDASRGQPDPLRGMVGIVKEDQLPSHMKSILDDQAEGMSQGRKPRTMTMSGQPDPTLAQSGIVVGCKVYHKERKVEGKVLDVSTTRAEVRRDDGKRQWWDLKKLVKL